MGFFSKKPAASPDPVPTTPATPESPTARRSIFSKPASPPTTPGSSVPAPTVPEVPATSAAPAGTVQELVPIAKPERPTTSVIPPQPVAGAPPWAHPGCRACKGTGMHPVKKVPCAGCRTTMMILKKPTDEAFEITYSTDGSLVWKSKDGTLGVVEAVAPVTAPQAGVTPVIEDPAAVAPKTRKPRGKKQPEVALDVTPHTITMEVPPDTKFTEVVETPAMAGCTPVAADCVVVTVGPKPLADCYKDLASKAPPELPLILLCGSFPEKVPGMLKVASMSDIFAEAVKLVAVADGEDFWSTNAFARRDALTKLAPEIAKRLAGTVVVAPRSGPDQMALVEALKPFATFVIYGPSN